MLTYVEKKSESRPDALPHLLNEIARIGGPVMADAARDVLSHPPRDLHHVQPLELARHLLWIVAIAHEQRFCEGSESGSLLVLRRRLLDRLRAGLIERWQSQPVAAEVMLRTLQRLESAHQALQPRAEQVLAAELTEAGAVDLVVEVAHDMRSPLTSILFLAEMLHKGQSGELNDVQRRQLGIVYSAALGLVGLASDMIEIARGGDRLSARNSTAFSVNEVIQSVADLVAPMAEEKQIELRLQHLGIDHRRGFPVPLSRILLNLTTNALKFTQEGYVEVAVQATKGTRVEFSVTDTGPGISESAQEHLFQPFRREPLRETGYYFSGTGLGLAMCRRLTRALGSELTLTTAPGRGTRFSFEVDLPMVSLL